MWHLHIDILIEAVHLVEELHEDALHLPARTHDSFHTLFCSTHFWSKDGPLKMVTAPMFSMTIKDIKSQAKALAFPSKRAPIVQGDHDGLGFFLSYE